MEVGMGPYQEVEEGLAEGEEQLLRAHFVSLCQHRVSEPAIIAVPVAAQEPLVEGRLHVELTRAFPFKIFEFFYIFFNQLFHINHSISIIHSITTIRSLSWR